MKTYRGINYSFNNLLLLVVGGHFQHLLYQGVSYIIQTVSVNNVSGFVGPVNRFCFKLDTIFHQQLAVLVEGVTDIADFPFR